MLIWDGLKHMMESREKLTDRRRIKRSRMQLILNSSSSQNSKFSWMDECTTTSRRGFPSHGKPRWNQNMCLFHMFWCFHTEAEVGERGSLWSESEKEGSVMSCGDGRNSARAVVPVSSSASHVNKCTWCTRSVLTVQGQDLSGMS